jgi:[acyl-carrier-protein] S-malonyltransferase
MASAQAELGHALSQVTLKAPSVPVISNVTAETHGAPASISARLIEQVTSPVRWEAGIRHLLDLGFTRFIELGPGKALSGFLRRIDRHVESLNVADLPSLASTLQALRAPETTG